MLEAIQVAELTFGLRLVLIVLDKLVLAGALALVVYYFNKKLQEQRHAHEKFLQDQKSRDELLNAIADLRVDAYKKLWEICKQVRFAKHKEITNEDRKNYDKQLDDWYYKDGGAMFLSWTASRRLMEARNALRDGDRDTEYVKTAFSTLRTELKYDCGVISSVEKPIKIGDLQDWQLGTDEKKWPTYRSLTHMPQLRSLRHQ